MKKMSLILITMLLAFTMMMSSCTESSEKIHHTDTMDTEAVSALESESEVTDAEKNDQQPEMNEPVVITENYLPAGVYSQMKVLFETGAGNFKAYPTASAPFAIRDLYTISNCRVNSISIPVYQTLGTDVNGNLKITLSEVCNTYNGLKQPVRKTHTVLISADEYHLPANATVKKFIKVDLTDYDIVLGSDETLAIFNPGDTLIPAYIGDVSATNDAANVMRRDFGVTGIIGKIGTSGLTTHNTILVFDFEFERTYKNRAAYEAVLQEEIDFQERLAAVRKAYSGKKLSILGDSISTYDGISNSTEINSTLGKNVAYYKNGSNFQDFGDTYWGQLIAQIDMDLCVCNAWSGSRVYGYGNGQTTGVDNMLLRSSQLARNDGTSPDIILVYMGINDFYGNSPEGNLYQILTNGDTSKTQREKLGEWFAAVQEKALRTSGVVIGKTYAGWEEAYALSIYNMMIHYDDAEIYCFTLLKNYSTNFNNAANIDKLNHYNMCIRAIADYFGVGLIDQQKGIMNESNIFTYGLDPSALHPNMKGHEAMAKHIINTLYDNLKIK